MREEDLGEVHPPARRHHIRQYTMASSWRANKGIHFRSGHVVEQPGHRVSLHMGNRKPNRRTDVPEEVVSAANTIERSLSSSSSSQLPLPPSFFRPHCCAGRETWPCGSVE